MIKSIAFTVLLFLFWPSANAAALTVKLASGGTSSQSSSLRGSGFLFEHHGQHYVVTSDHVVLHRKNCPKGPCHYVLVDSVWLAADLIAADWGVGLALLSVPLKTAVSHVRNLDSLVAAIPGQVTGARASTEGYPFSSLNPFSDLGGRVLLDSSPRFTLPMLDSMIELIEAHGEFGMSGGPAFLSLPSGKQFLGILSHQYLSLRVANASLASDFDAGSQVENHLLVIRARDVWSFVRSQLQNTPQPVGFISDASAKPGTEAIISEGLRFQMTRQKSVTRMAGGGDGGGIGGKETSQTLTGQSVMIESKDSDLATFFPISSRRAEFQEWKRLALARKHFRILGFLGKRSSARPFQFQSVTTLAEFVSLLRNPNLVPVVAMEGVNQDKRREAVNKIGESISAYLKQQNARDQNEADFAEALFVIQRLIQENAWPALDPVELQSLLHPHGAYQETWLNIYTRSFDQGLALADGLRQLECLLRVGCSLH